MPEKTVAATLPNGDFAWFEIGDARCWKSESGSRLFLVAGQWVVSETYSELTGEPARGITDVEALSWITSHGFCMPRELVELSVRYRIAENSQ